MLNAMALAALWRRNKAVNDEWVDDYCARTGSTREDVIAERKTRWIRDSSANKLGTYQGYELTTIQVGDGGWRYTVITPWGVSEGLGDLPTRDDDAAVARLTEVIKEMAVLPDKIDQKPTETKKTPPQAPERATEAHKTEPEPTSTRRRGRPKGSKDSKPRRRRTKTEMVSDTPKTEPETGNGGLVLSDNVAWIADSTGCYRSHEIWLGGGMPQVKIGNELVDLPMNALVWKRGPKPAMLKRWEQGIEKSWLPDVE